MICPKLNALTPIHCLPPFDLPHTPVLITIEIPFSVSPPQNHADLYFRAGVEGHLGWLKETPRRFNAPIYWLLSRHRATDPPPCISPKVYIASKTMWDGTCFFGYKTSLSKWEIPCFVHLFGSLIWKRGRGEYHSFIPPTPILILGRFCLSLLFALYKKYSLPEFGRRLGGGGGIRLCSPYHPQPGIILSIETTRGGGGVPSLVNNIS